MNGDERPEQIILGDNRNVLGSEKRRRKEDWIREGKLKKRFRVWHLLVTQEAFMEGREKGQRREGREGAREEGSIFGKCFGERDPFYGFFLSLNAPSTGSCHLSNLGCKVSPFSEI